VRFTGARDLLLPRDFPALTSLLRGRLALYCVVFLIHMAGLIHGDFWKHNVVKNAQGLVRVIDFSHARGHTCGGPERCDELDDLPHYLGLSEQSLLRSIFSLKLTVSTQGPP
jgi:hypothetical protein